MLVAESTLRELGRPSLDELTIQIAQRDPRRHPRVSARWLLRYLEACEQATIDEAALVTASLVALGGDRHAEAATAPYPDQIKPANFLLVAHPAPSGQPTGADPARFALLAPYEPDPRR